MRKLGYVPALDGVRGIAIALVVGYHLFGFPRGGYLGVDVFFVLSGFLITTLLLEEHDLRGTVSLRGFYGRRVRRLAPALVFLLAVLLVVAASTLRGPRLFQAIVGGVIAVLYGTNIADAANVFPAAAGWITHLWSLAQEEQFYLLWPALFLVLRRLGLVRVGLACAVAAAGAWLLLAPGGFDRVYYAPDTHALPIVAGCALAAAPRLRVGRWWLLALAALFATSMTARPDLGSFRATCLVGTACAALIVSAAAWERPLLLELKGLVWLGRISYSLYLWHPVCRLAADQLPAARTIAALAFALAAAAVSYRFVEQPFRRRRARQVLAVAAATG